MKNTNIENLAIDATSTGAVANGNSPKLYSLGNYTVQVNVTGAPTAIELTLEGSLDGRTYFSLQDYVFTAIDISAQAAMFHLVNKPVTHRRVNITTLTGGTAPTVSVIAGIS